ncbi:MAG: hypothetical protein KDC90_18555, partial [Ignavibacteriae bacterium]|nr:hypothetical protein [Ignavibacteriota bacterium]
MDEEFANALKQEREYIASSPLESGAIVLSSQISRYSIHAKDSNNLIPLKNVKKETPVNQRTPMNPLKGNQCNKLRCLQ